ncbi:MAG: META domain-containing protein [Chloroflexi bacterium]|nr:META domain-containing protein [Chloroflexota bacterium]MBL7164236.1 META domain-containing protein [Anaerolineales bacterium]
MRKYTLVCVAFVLAIAVLLTACKGADGISGYDPLDGTSWVLFAYRKTRPISDSTITAIFEDGQIHGSAGCNSFGGTYSVDGDNISFENIAITLMACLEPAGIMEQEQAIMQFIWGARTYQLSDGQLQIFRLDGEALTFVPSE